jgi:hypothetical protein
MRARASLVATAAAIALLAPASATAQSYGGGVLPGPFQKSSHYRPSAGVALERHGGRVTVGFDTSLRCHGDGLAVEGRRTVRLQGDRVRAHGHGVHHLAGGPLRFRWSLRAKLGPDRAPGVLTLRGHWRGRSCAHRGGVRFETRVATPPTGPPAAAAPGTSASTSATATGPAASTSSSAASSRATVLPGHCACAP